MTRHHKPSLDELLEEDDIAENLPVIRAELADTLRGRGPLPWVLAVAIAVVAWLIVAPA